MDQRLPLRQSGETQRRFHLILTPQLSMLMSLLLEIGPHLLHIGNLLYHHRALPVASHQYQQQSRVPN